MKTGVLCLLFGYLIGTVNPAYMMSKMRGFDIREEGSGNAGLLLVSVVMFCKHKENIMRIMEGKEVRVSYLWNKEKEKERLQEYYDV